MARGRPPLAWVAPLPPMSAIEAAGRLGTTRDHAAQLAGLLTIAERRPDGTWAFDAQRVDRLRETGLVRPPRTFGPRK